MARKRYRLVEQNFRCRYGEIDLIVKNRQYIVFVEVKLRKSAQFALAADFVDQRKQARLRTTAAFWLAKNETELQPRFDVVEVYAPGGMATRRPEIRHWEDAFQ